MKKNEETALATVDATQFQIMKMDQNAIQSMLNENLGADSIAVQDLVRVKVPSGGGKIWTVPSIEGDHDVPELVGIIVFTKNIRTYWVSSFDDTGGGIPPDCYSPDGVKGIGEMANRIEGGLCENCPMSKFAEDGSGQPCKEGRLIFMVLRDEILPIVIKAPVMSLGNAKKYLLGLTSRVQRIHSVYTKLTLEADKNKKGMKYSKIIFEKVGDVENPELTEAYAKTLRPFIDQAAARIVSDPASAYTP
jgi:hypothetical protein